MVWPVVLDMAFITSKISTALHGVRRGGSTVASVYRASFTQVLIGCLYAIALPNVLIFKLHLSPGFLGILGAVGALAYIAGPVIFRKWSSNSGTRASLIDIATLESATMVITLGFLSPTVLVVSSALEGLLASIYWTNMNVLVSRWQACTPKSKQSAIFKKYGLSWNLGGIAGEIVGFLVIWVGFNDYVVCLISLGLEALHFYFLNGIVSPGSEDRKFEARGARNTSRIMAKRNNHMVRQYLFVLVLLMIMGELCLQVIKSTYDFLFPFIVFRNEDSSEVVYEISLFQQLAQMVGIYASSKLDERGQYRGAVAAIGATIVLTACVLEAPAMIVIAASLIVVGFAGGLIYGFTAQVMLRCNNFGPTMRFAGLYESFSGIGEGIMVLITGFTSESGFSAAFMVLEWYLVATFVIFVAFASGMVCASKKMIKPVWPGVIPRIFFISRYTGFVGQGFSAYRAISNMHMLAMAGKQPLEPRYPLVLSPEALYL